MGRNKTDKKYKSYQVRIEIGKPLAQVKKASSNKVATYIQNLVKVTTGNVDVSEDEILISTETTNKVK